MSARYELTVDVVTRLGGCRFNRREAVVVVEIAEELVKAYGTAPDVRIVVVDCPAPGWPIGRELVTYKSQLKAQGGPR